MTDIKCKKCGSNKHVKNGNVRGEQRYLCKECGCNFIEIDRRVRIENAPLKALCVLLYSLCKGTFRGMGEVCGVAHTSVYRWVKTVAEGLPEPEITAKIQDIEIDEMWHFLRSKKTNDGSSRQWIVGPAILSHGILKAVDRRTRHTIAWVIGGRDIATVKRLYAKLEHLKNATFYTDDWDAFAAVLPPDRHIIGKQHTVTIERNNSNTRHRLARMTRKTKVVSRAEFMIDLSMRLFAFFEPKNRRVPWIQEFLSIF